MLTLDVMLPGAGLDATAELASLADRDRFHTAWIPDAAPGQGADLYAAMAECGLRTQHVRIGAGVTNPVTRHAAVTANAMSTVDEASHGRGVLGIGLGGSTLRPLGLQPARVSALAAYVKAVRRYLDGRPVPVYVAAGRTNALRAAGEIGDGVMASVGVEPLLIRRALDLVHRPVAPPGREAVKDVVFVAGLVLDERPDDHARYGGAFMRFLVDRLTDGRHSDPLLPSALDWVHEDAARYLGANAAAGSARSGVSAALQRLSGALLISGSPSDCVMQLRAMERAGALHVALHPLGPDPAMTLRRFSETVLPRLRA